MQCVINKCFLLNPEKNLAQIRLVVFEKNTKTHTLIPKNYVIKPNFGIFGIIPKNFETIVFGSLKLTFSLLIV